MSSPRLAGLCEKVASNASAYLTSISSEARKMKREWGKLQTASVTDYKKRRAVDSEKAALKKRMVEFLWDLAVKGDSQ